MKILVFAVLAGATGVASATPSTCAQTGEPTIEIDHGAIEGANEPTSVTKVYASGAWTFAETLADGKPGRAATGCLDATQRAAIDKSIKAVPWKITHPQAHCMAMATTFTTYTIGKTKFTQKLCGNDILDPKSSSALADIHKVLDPAMTASASAR